MVDLSHLRTFVTVAELQHLTHAAERLHMSQPAASAHIKALEEALGLPLFERRAGGLALTTAGAELASYAREALAACATLHSKAREISRKVDGTFRLGVRGDAGLIPLGDLVRLTRQRFPALALDVHQVSSLGILGGIQNSEFDAGFALFDRLPAGVTGVALRIVRYGVVAPSNLAGVIASADIDVLLRLPWIGAPRGGSHDQMLRGLFGERVTSLNRVVEADQEAAHAELVEAGVGLALMREERALSAERRGIAAIWRGGATETTLHYVYAEQRSADPAVQAVKSLAVELCTPSPPG
jgi:DNA-binding transcriptional LysR family regulator